LFIIFCLWILFFLLLILFPDVNDVRLKVFNPYRILNVKKGDDSGTIKRAYRKASLKWHPDKNFEKNSEKRFMLMTEAYKKLTDEKTKNQFKIRNVGDVDHGRHTTIGLPSLLNYKDVRRKILIIYFYVMLLLCFVIKSWWNYVSQFDKAGLLFETNKYFSKEIKSNLNIRHCIEILVRNSEFKKMAYLIKKFTIFEKQQINILKDNILGIWFEKSIKYYPDYVIIMFYVHVYLPRNAIPSCVKPLMKYFLKLAPKLLDSMIHLSLKRSFIQTAANVLEIKHI